MTGFLFGFLMFAINIVLLKFIFSRVLSRQSYGLAIVAITGKFALWGLILYQALIVYSLNPLTVLAGAFSVLMGFGVFYFHSSRQRRVVS